VEHERFDRIAKSVGHRTSRRMAVAAGALVLGFFGLRREVPMAKAAGSEFCRSLEPEQIISKHHCVSTNCGSTAESECVCVQTPGHVVRCAARFKRPNDCPQRDECSERRPCGRGRFCAKTFACCGGRDRRVCVRPCQG
jgi:hypothetical protein